MTTNSHGNNTLNQLNEDLENLEHRHEALVASLSKVNEEIHLLEVEKVELLEDKLESLNNTKLGGNNHA